MVDFDVTLTPEEAMAVIEKQVVDESLTGDLVDKYILKSDSGVVGVMVLEKHFLRVNNYLTLTVTINNFNGKTHVHAVGGGGAEGLLNFDRGASDSFEIDLMAALYQYLIK